MTETVFDVFLYSLSLCGVSLGNGLGNIDKTGKVLIIMDMFRGANVEVFSRKWPKRNSTFITPLHWT